MDGMARDMRIRPRGIRVSRVKEEQELVGTSQSKIVCLGPVEGVHQITLRVQRQNEEDIFYRLRRVLPLEHLMNDYCKRQSLAMETVRFTFDGNKVSKKHTAENLKMEDDDIIDIIEEVQAFELRKREEYKQVLLREKKKGVKEHKLPALEATIVHLGPVIGADLLTLQVKSLTRPVCFYRLSKNLRLRHLMNDYSYRMLLDSKTPLFLFDGERVRSGHTAQLLEMINDDIIVAVF